MTLGADKTLSRDVEVFLMTGDVPGVRGIMMMTTRDTGATMNANGDLSIIRVMFQSSGSAKPAEELW